MSLRSLRTSIPACLLLLALPLSGAAEEQDSTDTPAPPPQAAGSDAGATLHGRLQLTIAEAIEMGLENNLNVAVERYSPVIAYEDSRIAWGAYDPEWFSEFTYARSEDPNSNQLISGAANVTRVSGGDGGIRGLLPFLNGAYFLRFDSSTTRTTVSVQTLSPELESSWSAGIRQPLLRDLIWNATWTRVRMTRILYDASQEEFRRQVMDTTDAIENAYWGLIASEEQQRVAEKSLETAQALRDQTQTQYEVGVVSRVEVTEAEAGVAQREFNLIVAENFYRNAQDRLIDLVLGPGLTADSTLEIEPTDRPQDFLEYDIDREQAVRTAFEHRPELAIADDEIERRSVDLKFRKNQRLPSLDGILSYGNKGLAGEQNSRARCVFWQQSYPSQAACLADPASAVPTTDYGSTFDDWFTESGNEQFTAGGILTIPIGNVAGRHSVSQGELELRKALAGRRRLEQAIVLEVRSAVRNLQSAQQGIEASRRSRVAAEEQLRAARIRLEYGESTPFDVLLKEQDFVQAESEEINAFRVYRTSATALDRAQGTILRSHNIEIEQVGALR